MIWLRERNWVPTDLLSVSIIPTWKRQGEQPKWCQNEHAARGKTEPLQIYHEQVFFLRVNKFGSSWSLNILNLNVFVWKSNGKYVIEKLVYHLCVCVYVGGRVWQLRFKFCFSYLLHDLFCFLIISTMEMMIIDTPLTWCWKLSETVQMKHNTGSSKNLTLKKMSILCYYKFTMKGIINPQYLYFCH